MWFSFVTWFWQCLFMEVGTCGFMSGASKAPPSNTIGNGLTELRNASFNKQTYDNMFWLLIGSVPVWTCYEVLLLWSYANGYAMMISPTENTLAFIALFFLVPFVHEVGFYFIHRFLHWPPLYRIAHYFHKTIRPLVWPVNTSIWCLHLFLLDPRFFIRTRTSYPYDQSGVTSGCSSGTRSYWI